LAAGHGNENFFSPRSKRASVCSALLALFAIDARLHACTVKAPDELVEVKLRPGATIGQLVAWAEPLLCEPLAVSAEDQARKLTVAVDGKVRAGDVRSLILVLARGTAASVVPKSRSSCPDLARGVTRVDATHFTVNRGLVNALLAQPQCVTARAVPTVRDGGFAGIKLFGIRADSPLAQLGLQNGDELETLNGLSLGTVDQALAAYGKLMNASEVVGTLQRRGSSMRLIWSIK
jgi:hypothetical protein